MKYRITVETLTPLHIGSGVELIADFDYVSQEKITFIINQDAIYAAELARNGPLANLEQPAAKLINPSQLNENSPYVRYTLKGGTTIERVYEQIKDIHGRAYLPGSSLKGAIRTALMSFQVASGIELPLEELETSKEWAAQKWERRIFGKSPNHDILRLLQVTDSDPLPLSPSPYELITAQVFETAEKTGSPIVIEAISKGITFQAEINIDELTLQYAANLDWGDRRLLLAHMVEIIQQVSQQRITEERTAIEQRDLPGTARFYSQLESFSQKLVGHHAAVLQLGWGTGWTGMTIGQFLSEGIRNHIRRRYHLGRPPGMKGNWEPDFKQPFPKSRRLRSIPSTLGPPAPGTPLGWVALSFEPSGKPLVGQLWAQLEQEASKRFHPTQASKKTETKTPENRSTQPHETTQDIKKQSKPPSETLSRPASPPVKPAITSFQEMPKPGDRFEGIIFSLEGRTALIELPGLDPDTQAYGVVGPEDNPGGTRLRENQVVTCEVIAVEQERQNYLCVRCRIG